MTLPLHTSTKREQCVLGRLTRLRLMLVFWADEIEVRYAFADVFRT